MIGLSRSQWEPYYNNGMVPNRRVGNGMPLEDVAPSDTYHVSHLERMIMFIFIVAVIRAANSGIISVMSSDVRI